ncbi:hypothetical protein C8Q76DRAFT_688608 [Earliella scabrosa]|nr:hypothetical protein C8Q76DRAFT_688608 [Earliella scabrosa]
MAPSSPNSSSNGNCSSTTPSDLGTGASWNALEGSNFRWHCAVLPDAGKILRFERRNHPMRVEKKSTPRATRYTPYVKRQVDPCRASASIPATLPGPSNPHSGHPHSVVPVLLPPQRALDVASHPCTTRAPSGGPAALTLVHSHDSSSPHHPHGQAPPPSAPTYSPSSGYVPAPLYAQPNGHSSTTRLSYVAEESRATQVQSGQANGGGHVANIPFRSVAATTHVQTTTTPATCGIGVPGNINHPGAHTQVGNTLGARSGMLGVSGPANGSTIGSGANSNAMNAQGGLAGADASVMTHQYVAGFNMNGLALPTHAFRTSPPVAVRYSGAHMTHGQGYAHSHGHGAHNPPIGHALSAGQTYLATVQGTDPAPASGAVSSSSGDLQESYATSTAGHICVQSMSGGQASTHGYAAVAPNSADGLPATRQQYEPPIYASTDIEACHPSTIIITRRSVLTLRVMK